MCGKRFSLGVRSCGICLHRLRARETADGLSVCECRQKNLIKNCSSAKMTIIEPSHEVFRWWCCFHPREVIQLRFFLFIILVRHLARNKSCYQMIITKFPHRRNWKHEPEGRRRRRPTKVNESFYFPAKSLPFKRSVTSRVFSDGKFFPSSSESEEWAARSLGWSLRRVETPCKASGSVTSTAYRHGVCARRM